VSKPHSKITVPCSCGDRGGLTVDDDASFEIKRMLKFLCLIFNHPPLIFLLDEP
jgi:hypothetical protein